MLKQRALRKTSLLALFALLWGLVFPTLAQAGVGEANAVWAEICTAQGIKKVQQQGGEHPSAGHQYTAEHCALCCLGGALAAVEPLSFIGETGFEPDALQFPHLSLAPLRQLVLLNAPPRAPPILPQA